MNAEIINMIREHGVWREGKEGGKRANLSWVDLSRADLSGVDLSQANLSRADLSWVDLSLANLREANLSGANLSGANLSLVDLSQANLSRADLSWVDLNQANLREANLSGANLSLANLSRANGLLSQSEFMNDKFDHVDDGYVVYKRIGETPYNAPSRWEIKPGAYLTEVVNPNRTDECGCGVNFGTMEWCERNYTQATLWRCLIEWCDAPGIVVPYNTDGKARCERLKLLEIVLTPSDTDV